MRAEGHPKLCLLLLALLTVAVAGAYYVGLDGFFVLDDRPNILQNERLRISALSAAGLHEAARGLTDTSYDRPLAYVSFAIQHYLDAGFDSSNMRAANVAVHILNSYLVFWVALQLHTRRGLVRGDAAGARLPIVLAFVSSAVWALHPIQLTNVLYVVQRMNSLSATFTLLGACTFVYGRALFEGRLLAGLALMSIGLGGGVILGFAGKETSVLLAGFVLIVELWFFSRSSLTVRHRLCLGLFYLLTVLAPALVGFAYLS